MTSVEVVGDARTELARLNKAKHKTADWVAGLEDDEMMAITMARIAASRRKMARKQAKRVARGLGGENGLKVPDVDVSTDEDSGTEGGSGGGRFGKYSRHNNNYFGGGGSSSGNSTVDAIIGYLNTTVSLVLGVKDAWLQVPFVLLLIATVLGGLQHFVSYSSNQTFNHPPNEVTLWKYCRFDTAYSVIVDGPFMSFNFFHIVAAMAVITLCYKLGGATQNFMALCGVGCGILALVATILDGILAAKACPHGSATGADKGCNYPFGSHWALSAVKNIAASVGMCLGAQVFDLIQTKIGGADHTKTTASGKTTTIVTAIPALLYSAFYFLMFFNGIDNGNNLYVVNAGKEAAKGAAAGGKGGKTSNSKFGGGPTVQGQQAEIGSSLVSNLAYYASLTQVIAWALLVPMVYKQRRLTTVAVPASAEGAAKAKVE